MNLSAPRIVEGPEMILCGFAQRFLHAGDAAIPALWARFAPHIGNIPGQIGHTTYGVISATEGQPGFNYLCAVEVQAPVPTSFGGGNHFMHHRIHPQTYAVFEHRDRISTLLATMQAIGKHGFSAHNLTPAPAPTLERYGESFDPNTGLGGVEIWIPIRT